LSYISQMEDWFIVKKRLHYNSEVNEKVDTMVFEY
jgi:hypothetical protein